jgi:hypothetical protein
LILAKYSLGGIIPLMPADDLIDTAKAAAILKISPRRVRQLITSKRLKSETVGGNFVIRRGDLAAVRIRKTGRPKKGG